MKTTQYTHSQLNEKIAVARSWKKAGWRRRLDNTVYEYWDGPNGETGAPLPDFCGDIAAAMPLLRELPAGRLIYFYSLSYQARRATIGFTDIACTLYVEVGKEAEAITCAWAQWKFGEIVELMPE